MSKSMRSRILSPEIGNSSVRYFLIAAVVPTLFSSWLAYQAFSRHAERETAESLRVGAGNYALALRDRLQGADETAEEVVRRVGEGDLALQAKDSYLAADFRSVWLIPYNKSPVPLRGFPRSNEAEWPVAGAMWQPGSPSLLITPENELLLFKAAPWLEPAGGAIAFQLQAERFWSAGQSLPESTEFCVFSGDGRVLHCTADIDAGIHTSLLATADDRGSNSSYWISTDDKRMAASWRMSLEGEFAESPFDIVAIRNQGTAPYVGASVWLVSLPGIFLALLLVAWLSRKLAARSLVPLQHFTVAARQIGSGDLQSRVRIRSGDEFERFAGAFNTMADKLARQISTLTAMSGIDRMILAGTKFEDVSEDVVTHLIGLTNCDAAAVIARDVDAPNKAKMISLFNGAYRSDRIDLPDDLQRDWCQPRQVELAEIELSRAPYKERFEEYKQNFVVLIPVVLGEDVKGILLLGFQTRFDMSQGSLGRCLDLAGRFAVALSSVEREETLYRQAHFDPLTNLPNRQLLKDRLEQHLASARIEQHTGAVLFLDLDRFKEINDEFGHSVGDVLLVQASERIMSEVRARDTVARLGGDEFVIVLPNVRNSSIVQATAERLLSRLGEAFSVDNNDHYVSASIGIVVFPDDGDSVEMLLKNADAAMYRAKQAGRNRFEFFSERLNAESRRKIGLERDLREALRNHHLEVYYQPQFDIASGRLSGAEALLRWDHPVEGSISPDEFVPLAEESGLIVDLGSWVIEQACKDLRELLDMGLHPGPMSINVSARQLRDQRFAQAVISPVRRLGIHPGYIQLEVTETAVAQNRDKAIQILQNLRRQGVRVAIDDFGTGYSSLSYLQQMPFDIIKIDKSFVEAIGASVASDNICRTIIKMAAELGKKSIAEGVEDRNQLDFLRSNGCDFIQGYFYSQALTQDEFIAFVTQQDFHTHRRKALEVL